MTESLITIPLLDIRAVLPFMGYQDIRYYLNGIYVEPHEAGCRLVATNGYVMAVLDSDESRCDVPRILAVSTPEFRAAIRWRIPPLRMDDDDMQSAEGGGENFDGTLNVATADSHVTLRTVDGFERFILPGKPFVDGKFPEWRKVIPRAEHLKPGLPSAISTIYLALLDKPQLKLRANSQVSFWHDERNPTDGPAVIRFDGLHELIVFVMPMRRSNPASTWPTWLV